jgi:hypothetical protein
VVNADPLRVEDESGDICLVQLDGSCSCGRSGCPHVARAQAVWSQDRGLLFVSKSGLHKELRRGDTAKALGYAGIIARYDPEEPRRYLRKIVTEETRNLDLLARIDSAKLDDWPELVRYFCRSAKDWELGWDVGWWSPSWVNALAEMGGWPPKLEITPIEVAPFIRSRIESNPDEVHKLVVWCDIGTDKAKAAVKEAVAGVLSDLAVRRHRHLADRLERAKYTPNDELTLLFEMATGIWVEAEAIDYREAPDGLTIDVPHPQDYVYDCHTWMGLERLRQAGMPLRWMEPMPPGLDLRWSGAEAGTLWRYLATMQHGKVNVPWEAVAIGQELRVKHERLVRVTWMDWKELEPEVV